MTAGGGEISGPSSADDIHGCFAAVWGLHAIKKGIPLNVELPMIDGITLWMRWEELEPEPGGIRWKMIDPVLGKAAAHGKIMNLGIFTGDAAPDHVKERVRNFTGRVSRHAGETANNASDTNTFPLPWDQDYLHAYFALVEKLAERYANHPNFGYFQIAGPSPSAMEMAIRIRSDECNRFREQGYTPERYTQAWKQTIDRIADFWPTKPLAMTLAAVPSTKCNGNTQEVWKELQTYLRTRVGSRAIIKIAFLNGKWWHKQGPNGPASPLISSMRELGRETVTGGEMFWSSRKPDESVNGPLFQAVRNAIDWNMQFVEVYQNDISDYGESALFEPHREALVLAHKGLKRSR